jgi:RND superfamily putative drug exporter
MLERWGRAVHRFRWLVLAVTALLVAGTAAIGPGVIGSLTSGGFETRGSESDEIISRIESTVGRQATDVVVLYSSADRTVDDPAYRQAVDEALAALPKDVVASTTTFWSTGGAPAFVSADRHATFAAVQFTDGDLGALMDKFKAVKGQLSTVGGGLTAQLGGPVTLNADINEQVSADLARAEMWSGILLVILLIIVFSSAVAASLPLAIGVFTVLGSFAVLRLLTGLTDVSIFALNIVTLLGLGLAIDYALFVVSRFREELNAGRQPSEALAVTMATAGRTVIFSGLTVALSLSSLLLFPQVFLKSMGYGGVSAVLVAMLAALTLLPALLAVLGHRVDALRIPFPRRRGAAAGQGWARFARTVMRRPLVFTLAAVAVLVTLALPFLRVDFGGIDSRALPEDAQARVVDDAMRADFPDAQAFPVQVLVQGGGETAAQSVSTAIGGLDGVLGVTPQAARNGSALLSVNYTGGALDPAAIKLVDEIRALPHPAGAQLLVGGSTAQNIDLRASIGDTLPWMALFMALATFALLLLAFGSVVLPLKAILTNLLSLGASFGVVVWIFQDGHLSGLLGFTPTGTIETTQPILMLAILFGLSMDYEVFLLSRIKERWDATGDATDAAAVGLQRTGTIITNAALLLVIVIGAFSTSGITFIKMIGVGMAVAIVVDVTIVRSMLVPALLRLLGPAAWWAPGPIRRWHARYGWRETDAPEPAATIPAQPDHRPDRVLQGS